MGMHPGERRGAKGTDLGGQFVGPKSIARFLAKLLKPEHEHKPGQSEPDMRRTMGRLTTAGGSVVSVRLHDRKPRPDDRIVDTRDPRRLGTVATVDHSAGTMRVHWDDGSHEVRPQESVTPPLREPSRSFDAHPLSTSPAVRRMTAPAAPSTPKEKLRQHLADEVAAGRVDSRQAAAAMRDVGTAQSHVDALQAPRTPGSERTDNERFGGGGKKALPPSKSASPRAEAVATDSALTDGEKRTRLKAMGMTPGQVDALVPPAKKASPAAAKMARGKAATPPFDAQQARTQLAAAKTHDEALAVLQGMSVAQLREVSPSAVKVSKGKSDAINKVLAYEAPHLYGEGLGASLPTLGLHGAAGEGKTLDLPSSALSRGLAGSPWESDHIAPASAPDLPAIRPAAAPSATAVFHQATGDRPTTYHANNALKGADAALKRGDSPADVAAGLREQAAALKREPLGEDGIMDRVGRSASERRDLRNAEAAQLVEVADRLDTMHAPSTPSHSPAGRPLSERQSQVLRDLVGRNGDRMAVEDARHDPELADLQERGLIRRYPLKGTIELTPAGRREMRTSSPAVAKVARAKAAPAKKAAAAAPAPTKSVLTSMARREDAAAALASTKKPELLALARELSIPRASSRSMTDLRKAIIEATVGHRLDHEARLNGSPILPY